MVKVNVMQSINNITMALVQEPYTCKATDVHKIPGLNGLKCMARSDDKFLSAIIYNGDNFSPLFIPQLSTKNIVVISAKIGITQVFVVSVFLPPSSKLSTDLPTLQRILTETAGHKVFIGGNFNVRSTCGTTTEKTAGPQPSKNLLSTTTWK
jgi:hypothetical protein